MGSHYLSFFPTQNKVVFETEFEEEFYQFFHALNVIRGYSNIVYKWFQAGPCVIGCPANRNFRQKSNDEHTKRLRVAHLFMKRSSALS